jgi:CheY-like chemotaxis protein
VSQGGTGKRWSQDEAAVLAALSSALERGAARGEAVSLVIALPHPIPSPAPPGEGSPGTSPGAVLEAARSELTPDGLAGRLAGGAVALVLPGVSASDASARAARIRSRCPGSSVGAASSEGRTRPVGPDTLLAEAEAEALASALRRRILIVEDDPDICEILEVFLTSRGRFEVVVARTGAEAVASVRERPPDAAVVDLELPDADGAEVVARLREEVPHLPAVACSGKRPADAAGAGFASFHRKPIDLSALVRDVEGLLRGANR